MHSWGERGFGFNEVEDAARFIGEGLARWRVNVRQYKEKYGEVRVYCSLGIDSWTQLTHPGYAYNQWPRWLDFLAYSHGPILRLLGWVTYKIHALLYIWYYREARRRWPHLAQEIYRGADFYELLGARVTNNTIWWPEWDEEPRPRLPIRGDIDQPKNNP